MDKDKLVELQPPPLRQILSRRFVAYEGTHYLLACGHTVVRKSNSVRSMRCDECAALRSHAQKEG